ncbi:hypothetical protein L3Y34_015176 [Caenorhabditis briggsae]|uniref:Uncharacterized protein n=1 Tax=Caenorhabditis briggsae TaxID=6238 RepID=A0AAE9IZ82_CAEBR|nr:hypothetical protein L3Y34_015176 [Caenorhabditis briggsae]
MNLFLSTDSNRFVPLINGYFNFYVLFGLIFQLFLIFLIITKSPHNLKDLKMFLYNTTWCQIANILAAYFIQYRALPNSTTMAVLASGFCRKFGPDVCFSTYHIFVGISSSVAMSISATVVFRYSLIKNWRMSKNALLLLIVSSHIPPIIATVEHLLNVMTCFPALIDPFISFYFIVPYRNAILRFVRPKSHSTIADVSTYVPPGVSFRHSSTLHE